MKRKKPLPTRICSFPILKKASEGEIRDLIRGIEVSQSANESKFSAEISKCEAPIEEMKKIAELIGDSAKIHIPKK